MVLCRRLHGSADAACVGVVGCYQAVREWGDGMGQVLKGNRDEET